MTMNEQMKNRSETTPSPAERELAYQKRQIRWAWLGGVSFAVWAFGCHAGNDALAGLGLIGMAAAAVGAGVDKP
jgi:hypothetical protein